MKISDIKAANKITLIDCIWLKRQFIINKSEHFIVEIDKDGNIKNITNICAEIWNERTIGDIVIGTKYNFAQLLYAILMSKELSTRYIGKWLNGDCFDNIIIE